MNAIPAVYESGVFRPVGPVDLPEGSLVSVHPNPLPTEPEPTPAQLAARRRVYEILSRRYDGEEPSDVLATHNDPQP